MKSEVSRRSLITSSLTGYFAASLSGAQGAIAPFESVGVTGGKPRTGIFNGAKIAYRAGFDAFSVTDKAGSARAEIRCAVYEAVGKVSPQRPVIFAFNGGPGTPSTWLNYAALGPRRILVPPPGTGGDGALEAEDNKSCLLDSADLVFIDPVDTGYSRALGDPVAARAFFDTDEDGSYIAEVILQWLSSRGRLEAPVFLVGESFGTVRACVVAHYLLQNKKSPAANLMGIVLISQGINMNELAERKLSRNVVAFAVELPSIARAARFFGLTHGYGDVSESAFEKIVEKFVEDEYLLALYKGRNLPTDEASRIAEKLSQFTGVDSAYFLKNGLAISRNAYRFEALKGRGEVLGRADVRYVAKLKPDAPNQDPFSEILFSRFNEAVDRELATYPGRPDRSYVMQSEKALKQWQFGNSPTGDRPFVDYLEAALSHNGQMRTLLLCGTYDFAAGKEMAQYLLAQTSLPRARVDLVVIPAGHLPYLVPAGHSALSDWLRGAIVQ